MTLEDMTLEELYELFPISLKPYDDKYVDMFERTKCEIDELLGDMDRRISHIGSTAVNGMPCKPIVDILVEIELKDYAKVEEVLKKNWILMGKTESPFKASFNKGYLETGYDEEVYHLHVKEYGDNDELYFRDMLNDDPELFNEYLALKEKLLEESNGNRDEYTHGKSEFVERVSELGKSTYKNRYKVR